MNHHAIVGGGGGSETINNIDDYVGGAFLDRVQLFAIQIKVKYQRL